MEVDDRVKSSCEESCPGRQLARRRQDFIEIAVAGETSREAGLHKHGDTERWKFLFHGVNGTG